MSNPDDRCEYCDRPDGYQHNPHPHSLMDEIGDARDGNAGGLPGETP